MSKHRFFCPDFMAEDKQVKLSSTEAHHARKVLRIKENESVSVFNGMGLHADGTVEFHGSSHCLIQVLTTNYTEKLPVTPVLALAIPEHRDTLHDIIRAAVQLGVGEITLLTTRYCGLRRSGKIDKLMEKCRRIIVNACKQCGQNWIPELNQPIAFETFLSDHSANVKVFCGIEPGLNMNTIEMNNLPLVEDEQFVWMIGPEGGWSEQEAGLIEESNICKVQFGKLTLTSHVAAIAGMAAILTALKKW